MNEPSVFIWRSSLCRATPPADRRCGADEMAVTQQQSKPSSRRARGSPADPSGPRRCRRWPRSSPAPSELPHTGRAPSRSTMPTAACKRDRLMRDSCVPAHRGSRRPFLLSRSFFAGRSDTGQCGRATTPRPGNTCTPCSMVLTLALSGHSFAGADVGGFFGTSARTAGPVVSSGGLPPFYRAHAHIDEGGAGAVSARTVRRGGHRSHTRAAAPLVVLVDTLVARLPSRRTAWAPPSSRRRRSTFLHTPRQTAARGGAIDRRADAARASFRMEGQ